MRRPRVRLGPNGLLDLHVYGGLMLAAVGGWQISRPWTLVVTGLALMTIGLVVSLVTPRTQ